MSTSMSNTPTSVSRSTSTIYSEQTLYDNSTKSLLATAKARIISPITSLIVRILIDSGSEISLISESVVNQLGLHRSHSSLVIMGFGATSTSHSKGIINCDLQSLHNKSSIKLQAHVTRNITTILPSHQTTMKEWPHINKLKLRLADDSFLTPQPIDIILGVNHYSHIIKSNIIKYQENMPIAQLSMFGWLVLGPCGGQYGNPTSQVHHLNVHHEHETLQELLAKFWVQEEVPINDQPQLTPEEEECERHFMTTHQRHSSGKYIVRLPLMAPREHLGDSYRIAKGCLLHLTTRLKKNQEYKTLYENFMNEYLQLGHMVEATSNINNFNDFKADSDSERMTLAHDTSVSGGLRVQDGQLKPRNQNSNITYYLPHHGVLKPESTSTKLRVVFNGSKATSSGKSLNDIMHTGSKIQRDITDVLLWIRKYQFIFTTDVTKMYRQIMVHEDDWNLQRILWFNKDGKITSYNLTTVTYGTRAAPFLAIRALLQLAQDEGDRFPLAVEPIIKGRYVDDIIGGADTPEKLLQIANQLTQLCLSGGLPLAKWQFNDQTIKEQFTIDQKLSTSPSKSTITFGDCTETKILGLIWHPLHDHFTFSIKRMKSNEKISKRTILSEVAQIYDPLGFISPITIRAKMLMQELWLEKFNWDDTLPSSISTKWKEFRNELSTLENIIIPRWTRTLETSSCELHGFSDASQLAMSAVVYLKVETNSNTHNITLICAKTKVAPLKRLSIPRLELAAALLLAKVIKYVTATIEVNVENVYLWTDSSVTLAWIKSHPSKWKDFVRNRVTQIQELTSNYQWFHVPGKSNPADCASRGISTQNLIDHSLWWAGPPWLSKSKRHWPAQPTHYDDTTSQEVRPRLTNVMTISPSENQWDLIFKYSNFTRLVKITSIIMKVCDIFKRKLPLEKSLSPKDLDRAELYWIRSTQQAYFNTEINIITSGQRLPQNHVLSKLTAFVDENSILRVGGRLEHSSLTSNEKHPAIIPRHSQLSTLIIDHFHNKTLHGGTQVTLATIRQRYWIIGGRAPVRSHILKCMCCARQRGLRAQQLMGQLPMSRVTISRPFQHTGLDYAGPINVKSWKGRGSKSYKSWICLFTCMATSAVHLEVVTDYATDGFLAAYRRFTSRRGICQALYSDCGTNFIGADAELKKLFNQASTEHQHIKNTIMNDHTEWHFNPPGAPHMGGKWEAVVKSIKHHLRRTISETLLTLEEFNTLLIQIEGILNSRPIEPLSDDPNDLTALTPGHFLIGAPLSSIPEPTIMSPNTSYKTSWQHIQHQLQQFWNRWSTSVLQRHLSTSKWRHERNEINIGDLVLLTDERFPPSKWPLARIVKLHPGSDGLTRVVTIKTSTTTLTRPIAKLALLPRLSPLQSTSNIKE